MEGVKIVEAIYEGRIVKVPEDYAKREGLLILKKQEPLKEKIASGSVKNPEEERRKGINDFRKPLKWRENRVIKELKENFQWDISKRRKEMNLSRKQLAEAVGEREEDIKLIENAILPREDFVLINKIQNFMGLKLRKDGQSFGDSMRKLVESPVKEELSKEVKNDSKGVVMGDEIEIFEGEED